MRNGLDGPRGHGNGFAVGIIHDFSTNGAIALKISLSCFQISRVPLLSAATKMEICPDRSLLPLIARSNNLPSSYLREINISK